MKRVLLFLSVLLLVVSCNDKTPKDIYDAKNIAFNESASAKRMINTPPPSKAKVERKLIKTGSLSFETENLEVSRKNILDLVAKFNGYVANDRENKEYDRISNTISLKIPSNSFDNFVVELSKGVEKFDYKNINISDVTEQFLDVEARLKTKKALETKYLEILKKAKTVKEILDVERELGKLREEIESTEGRLKYLQNQVSFSTLTLTFYKKIVENESSFFGKISESFKNGFENIKNFFLYLINIWPFIIILFIVLFYIRKRRIRAKNKS